MYPIQKADPGNLSECSNDPVFPNGDGSPYSAFTPLPRVIEKSERTIIAHGVGTGPALGEMGADVYP